MSVALKHVPALSPKQYEILNAMACTDGFIVQEDNGAALFMARYGWTKTVRTDTLRFLYDWGLVNAKAARLGATKFTISTLALRALQRHDNARDEARAPRRP